jgi:hypothetical protein
MPEVDPYASWSLSDRLQMLAFEAELAHPPQMVINVNTNAPDTVWPAFVELNV